MLFVTLFYQNSNAQDCYLTDSRGHIVKKCTELLKANEIKKFEQGTYLIMIKTDSKYAGLQVASIQMADAPVLKVKSVCLYLSNDTIDGEDLEFESQKWKKYNRQVLQIKAHVDLKIQYIKRP